MIGDALGQYRIVDKIGEGGMGVVYSARDTRLNRAVAIKVLRADVAENPERLARFQREAVLLAALNHPNIGGIHGLEEQNGLVFLVLELVDGETLARRIARGPLGTRDAIDIARQIARAMEEAHEKGIVHRDLKPANVKVTPDGVVKVLDFGLAKALSGDSSHDGSISEQMTREWTILGTPAYMSPEQGRGGPVDATTDIWAFGCVLFEMLTGVSAFGDSTPADVSAAVLRGEVPWTVLAPGVPPLLRTLVKSCLDANPRNRLRHIRDARLLLDAALSETSAATTEIVRGSPPRPAWRSPAAVAGPVAVGPPGGVAPTRGGARGQPPP